MEENNSNSNGNSNSNDTDKPKYSSTAGVGSLGETPEDIAAAFFKLEQPKLRALLTTMSERELRRLMWNLVSYPFVPKEQELKKDIERSAFYLAEQMLYNKTIMKLAAEINKVDEAEKNKATITNETKEENGAKEVQS